MEEAYSVLQSKILLDELQAEGSHSVHENNSKMDCGIVCSSKEDHETESTKNQDDAQGLHQEISNIKKVSSSEKSEFHPVPEDITSYPKIILEMIVSEVERNQCNVNACSDKQGLFASTEELHEAGNSETSGTAQTADGSLSKFYSSDKSERDKPVLGNHELKSKTVLEDIVPETSQGVHENNSEVDCELVESSSKDHETESTKNQDKAQALHQKTLNFKKFSSSEKCEFHPVPEDITSYPKVILERIVSAVERTQCNVANACNNEQELPAFTEERHKAKNSKTSETAETTDGMTISLSKFYPSDKSKRDKPVFENHYSAPQPRILLKRVKVEVPQAIADGRPAKWDKRLRARPPVEKIIKPREEKRKTPRIQRIQEKVNYCELSSSDEDDEDEHIKKKRTDPKSGKWSGESSSESMSVSDDSSDEDYMQRKRLKLKIKTGSNSDRSKTNRPGIRSMIKKETHLSEYEKLRNKNIEEKLAFLEALKFSELEEDL